MEEAQAAFQQLHNRLASIEEAVHGAADGGASGMVTRLNLIEQLISAGGATRGDRNVRRSNLACSKGCSDIPIFGGEYEEYEDWQYKVRIFLNSECPLFAKFFTYLEGLDREVDEEDVREFGEGRDFEGNTADVVWMNQQLFNILAQKTKGNPFQTVKNMADDEGCSGAGAWVKLLRAYKGKNASRSQRLTERVHDIKSVTSYSEVLPRMEKWEAALKEHVKDTGREVADITMANCLRRLVPTDLYADLQKMSHIVLYSDIKRYIIDQVGLRICHDPRRQKLEHQGPVPMDTSLAETHYNEESGVAQDIEDPELNALKGKGKGFKGQCFHCGQYGHRLSECRKKDTDMMKGKGKSKGFSKGKTPPQQQQQYGKGKGWYWSEPWSEPWKVDQECTPWKSMGGHKAQAITQYCSSWTHYQLVRMSRPSTCNTCPHQLRTTWKRWQRRRRRRTRSWDAFRNAEQIQYLGHRVRA